MINKNNINKIRFIVIFSLYILLILFTFIFFDYLLKYKELFSNKNNKEYQYTAIIIEPRDHKALSFVLENFLENLSDEWQIIIFHGNKNIDYIHYIINSPDIKKFLLKKKNKIILKNLNIENLTLEDYNHLLVSKNFYDNIPTETFLIFQTDSIICKNDKELINEFLKYDYVGAPWRDKKIGNGGLSLRKKSKMLEIISKCEYNKEPEDFYFSQRCPEINRNLPSFEDAKKFSMETVYSDNSFGIHKPWVHLNKNLIERKNNLCDGLLNLVKLNKK